MEKKIVYAKKCEDCKNFYEAELIHNFMSPCFECVFNGLDNNPAEDNFSK